MSLCGGALRLGQSAAPLPPPESSAGVEFPCSHSSSLRPHHLRLASRYLASLRKLLQHVSAIKQESRIMLLPGRPIAWLSRPACGSAKPALTAPRPQPRPPPWRPLVPPRTDVGCDRADAPRLRHPRPDAPVLRAAYANRDMRSLRPAKHSTKCARTPHGQLGCAPLRSRCRHGSRHHRRSATTPRPQVKNVSSDAGSHTLYALPSAAQVQHQPGEAFAFGCVPARGFGGELRFGGARRAAHSAGPQVCVSVSSPGRRATQELGKLQALRAFVPLVHRVHASPRRAHAAVALAPRAVRRRRRGYARCRSR